MGSRRAGSDAREWEHPKKAPAFSDLDEVVGLIETLTLEDWHADVKDWHAALGLPLKAPVVRVAMEGDARVPLVEGARQVARSEEGVYLRRFALYRGPDRRVV